MSGGMEGRVGEPWGWAMVLMGVMAMVVVVKAMESMSLGVLLLRKRERVLMEDMYLLLLNRGCEVLM